MRNYEEEMIRLLFKTDAVRICEADTPFWYTSGTIGPYYINTHFLYGNEERAKKLLESIDVLKNKKLLCPEELLKLIEKNYNYDKDYEKTIDLMVGYISDVVNLDKIDYISGGERRDWFFSLMIAKILNKPHITIYKDLACFVTDNEGTHEVKKLMGANVFHIADLLNEGSSYIRAWIPAIKNIGGTITDSLVVVDRNQGGEQLIVQQDVRMFSIVSINKSIFNKAKSFGLINEKQNMILLDYIDNPKESMKKFLIKNPEFLQKSLRGDNKTVERAKLCIENNIYGIDA
jgi:orotate phosphoribosyltransferase